VAPSGAQKLLKTTNITAAIATTTPASQAAAASR